MNKKKQKPTSDPIQVKQDRALSPCLYCSGTGRGNMTDGTCFHCAGSGTSKYKGRVFPWRYVGPTDE